VKGRIDIILANAGVADFVPFGKVSEEHFDTLFNINVKGALFTVQKGLSLLNDGGSIILMGSVASVKGSPGSGVYAASKAAIRSFVRTWTTDLKDRHIRSNVISPGPIRTPLTNRQSADLIARFVSTVPMGRMGEPDEVAKAAFNWRQMIRASSRVLNFSSMGAERKSNSIAELLGRSTGCSRRRRGGEIGLSFAVAHLFEIGDQSRPGRAPRQPLLGERT